MDGPGWAVPALADYVGDDPRKRLTAIGREVRELGDHIVGKGDLHALAHDARPADARRGRNAPTVLVVSHVCSDRGAAAAANEVGPAWPSSGPGLRRCI